MNVTPWIEADYDYHINCRHVILCFLSKYEELYPFGVSNSRWSGVNEPFPRFFWYPSYNDPESTNEMHYCNMLRKLFNYHLIRWINFLSLPNKMLLNNMMPTSKVKNPNKWIGLNADHIAANETTQITIVLAWSITILCVAVIAYKIK